MYKSKDVLYPLIFFILLELIVCEDVIYNFDEFTQRTTNNVTLTLSYSGSQCANTLKCTSNETQMDEFVCSYNATLWNNGIAIFNDPIPGGNTIYHVQLTYLGRYYCDSSQPKTSFIALLNDELLASSRFDMNPSGCGCNLGCGTVTTVQSNDQIIDYGTYHYGQQNTIQTWLITNDVCLSTLNVTFFFRPFVIEVSAIEPDEGVVEGGTPVNVTGSGWKNSTGWWCMFGPTPARATYIDDETLECITPAVSGPSNVTVRVTYNYQLYSNTSVMFSYYSNTTTSQTSSWEKYISKYWWILIIASPVLLLIISFFILTFKRKQRRSGSLPELSPLLGSSNSLIRFREDIDYQELRLGERIGRGNFGEVYVGYWRNTKVAIKKVRLLVDHDDEAEILADFEREGQIMRSLRHPNILQFLGICDAGNNELCIIMEYMQRGSLYRTLHDKSNVLDWDLKLSIAMDIARGMNYLHRCQPIIIHRDLKTHNLLLDESYKVKVGDFGLAKLMHSQDALSQLTSCGTPAWTAPEVLRNEMYDEKCDCYSFGIVLWELLTREDPHHGMPSFQIVFAVGTQGIRPIIPSSCPVEFAHLIEELWDENPKMRPSFEESLQRLEEFKRSGFNSKM